MLHYEDNTTFEDICNKFYNRIEKDQKFFNYYNVDIKEAKEIAKNRARNYLCDALDYLSCIPNMDVDFSDYDDTYEEMNFHLYPKEIRMIVEIMFLIYMKRDETLLHAMEINFTPSDLSVFSPANERTSYRNFISQLTHEVEIMVDNYKNRDRKTNELKYTIDYTQYSED